MLADLRSGANRPELAPGDQARTKAMNAVHYILDNKLINEGDTLFFKSHTKSRRELVDRWLAANPSKGQATWVNHRSRPLLWENEPRSFAPTPLALKLIEQITGTELKSVRGPDCWVTADGRSLTELAEEAKRRAADG